MTTGNNSPDQHHLARTLQAPPVPTADDIYYFREGTNNRLYRWLGAHPCSFSTQEGQPAERGCWFAVWAPNAREVEVIGDFNGWQHGASPLNVRGDSSGIWEGFVPRATVGDCYKYRILSGATGEWLEKGDPFGFSWEEPPRTATRIADLSHEWHDQEWMKVRAKANALDAPIAIYECHLGSWMRPGDNPQGFLNYRDIAPKLADYVQSMGFTHVELMPITEHPFYGSWGYQTVGYFAPTARYGSPEDFKFFVDYLHQRGIGVILDWVPSHFPGDAHGLHRFDGTELYEHADRRQGFHPEWNSWIFNYGRHEVRAFLLSSAAFWLDEYHIDGLRVDAVASMLYLDYSRKDGEWVPNRFGGRENLEAIHFLRQLNQSIYRDFPDVQTIAEESTAWPGVSRPVAWGGHSNDNPETMNGLGFGMKWNMGWMHDTLSWFEKDPVYRSYHQNALSFSLYYAFNENFVLPLSHDEVVYGKGSLLTKMPGDDWQKFANLRLLFGLMWTHPGKKLLFMGGEFGQWTEWAHEGSLNWDAADTYYHVGIKHIVGALNHLMRTQPALHQRDFDGSGFEWISADDSAQSVLAYLRHGNNPEDTLMVIFNGTPMPRHHYRLGAPQGGRWQEIFNSDASIYGGTDVGNHGFVEAIHEGSHGRPYSLELTLPPLGLLVLKPQKVEKTKLPGKSKAGSADDSAASQAEAAKAQAQDGAQASAEAGERAGDAGSASARAAAAKAQAEAAEAKAAVEAKARAEARQKADSAQAQAEARAGAAQKPAPKAQTPAELGAEEKPAARKPATRKTATAGTAAAAPKAAAPKNSRATAAKTAAPKAAATKASPARSTTARVGAAAAAKPAAKATRARKV